MPKVTVLWTALPSGLTGTAPTRRAQLSVYVSMRLQTDNGLNGTLGLFPDILNWPTLLTPDVVTFMVQGAGGQQIRAAITSPAPDPALWSAVFNADTPVESHKPDDLTGRPINTYSAVGVLGQVREGHQQLTSSSPVSLPSAQTLGTAYAPIHSAFTADAGASSPPEGLAAGAGLEQIHQTHDALASNIFRPQTDVHQTMAQLQTLAQQQAAASPGTPVKVVPDASTNAPDDVAARHFAQLYGFHYRPPPNGGSLPPPATLADVLDFHRALSALSSYPDLLRRLGLVVDLTVPESSLPQSSLNAPSGRLQIVSVFSLPVSFTGHSPWTAYILDGDQIFMPASQQSQPDAQPAPQAPGGIGGPQAQAGTQPEYIGGFLNLALPDTFSLIDVDVDSVALKTIQAAATAALQAAGSPPALDEVAAPPAMDNGPLGAPPARSVGLSVSRSGHGEALVGRFTAAQQHEAALTGLVAQQNPAASADPAQGPTLFAEDLARGWRFDVYDVAAGTWHSLHSRAGTYAFPNHAGGPQTLTITDEGFSNMTAVQSVDGSPAAPPQLYIHESLMHWQGWSLSAPRPGMALTGGGPAYVTNSAVPGGIGLEVNFKAVPGSLPRLRYGRAYRIRARAVDLAGNSLSDAEADAMLQLLSTLSRPAPVLPGDANGFVYRRYEPVSSPVLVPRERFTEGESLEHLVIRSNVGETAVACAQRLNALPASATGPAFYTDGNERHVVPPKVSQLMAETFGLFDPAIGAGAATPAATTYNVARKEKGRLSDTAIIDVTSGAAVPIPDVPGLTPGTTRPAVGIVLTNPDGGSSSAAATPGSGAPSTAATDSHSGPPRGYVVHHEAQVQVPYLPDFPSRGAAFAGLPGVPAGQTGSLDAGGNLQFGNAVLPPATMSVLGSLTQIDFGPGWPGRLPFRLRVVEPADRVAPPPPPTWDASARVLTVFLAQAEQVSVRLSSFLGPNDLGLLGIWQWALEREAALNLPPPTAGDAQTAQAGAMWMLTPFREVRLVHAVQQPLRAPDLHTLVAPRDPGTTFAYLGATIPIHAKSTVRVDLFGTWQETVDRPTDPGPVMLNGQAHVFDLPIYLPDDPPPVTAPGTVPIAQYDPVQDQLQLVVPVPDDESGRTFLSRHEFGDTRYRRMTYRAVATTRFREYFPEAITSDLAQITRTGAPVTVDVPSTVRPAPPRVVYAVPSFQWARTTNPDGSQVRIRKASGVRVYLERPWYSSGDGELLAVVLAGVTDYPPNDVYRPLLTHWGNDPAWNTDPVPRFPQVSDFTGAVATGTGLSLDENYLIRSPDGSGFIPSLLTVNAAAHDVAFDPDRRLWYSDIAIDVGSAYSPFVRLALARYQPHSLPGMELSRVALADFVQILPQRQVTVTPVPGNPDQFKLRVDGLAPKGNVWRPGDTDGDTVYQLSATLADAGQTQGTVIAGHAAMDSNGAPVIINPAPPLVVAAVEQRLAGTSDELGWQPVVAGSGSAITVTTALTLGTLLTASAPLWEGAVTLPSGRQAGQYRVVIKEYERFPSDDRFTVDVEKPLDSLPDAPPDVSFFTQTFAPGSGRVVFVETIEL